MTRNRSFAIVALVALCATLATPAFAVQCSCHYCVPGNLLAQCDWPGYGTVYCVDYWEFQCAWGPGLAPAADEPFAEPLAWLDTLAEEAVDAEPCVEDAVAEVDFDLEAVEADAVAD